MMQNDNSSGHEESKDLESDRNDNNSDMEVQTLRYANSVADSCSVDLSSTITKLQRLVDRELNKLMAGEIELPPPQTELLLESLARYTQHTSGRHRQAPSNTRQLCNPGGAGGSRPPNGNRADKSNSTAGPRAERLRCGHPGCRKPLGHTTERCYQRRREEKEGVKEAKRP